MDAVKGTVAVVFVSTVMYLIGKNTTELVDRACNLLIDALIKVMERNKKGGDSE